MSEGYLQSKNYWKITANHKVSGVSAEIVDWWWDHIDTTERYRFWHPTDHVSFTWIVPPTQTSNGHVGAIHRVEEFMDGKPEKPLSLEVRWEDPSQAEDTTYAHVLLASGKSAGGLLDARLMHEYEDDGEGGIRMRSHFWLPAQAPEAAVAGLYRHNKQEMANLANFLPDLYALDVIFPARLENGYFQRGELRLTKERISTEAGREIIQYRLQSIQDKTYHMTGGDLATIIKHKSTNPNEWTWHPN